MRKLLGGSLNLKLLLWISLQISYRISYRIISPYLELVRRLNLKKVNLEIRNSLDTDSQIGKQTILDLVDKHNPIIFEIGANIGTDTLEFSLMYPNGVIHAFEPLPLHINKLVQNTQDCKNVKIISAALSDTNGLSKFYQSSGYSGGSGSIFKPTLHLVRDTHTLFKAEDECLVPTVTLDRYLQNLDLKEIDFVWIDAQGAELKILNGAIENLQKIRFIYSEVSTVPYYEGACTESELIEFLGNHNFLVKKRFRPVTEECGNILWERKEV